MMNVYFSNIQTYIYAILNKAEHSVNIALAWFTNESLYDLLLQLLRKGVKVRLLIMYDVINCNKCSLNFNTFIENGGRLFFVNNGIMHNKFCIIDYKIIITGSYNWTYSAECLNAENIIVFENNDIAKQFEKQFNQLLYGAREVSYYQPIDERLFEESKNIEIKQEMILKDENRLSMTTVQPPMFSKGKNSNTCKERLCDISIGTIFRGPAIGRKYVHARYCLSFRNRKFEVDIIDDDFVNDVRQYFHKCDGGLIDDNLPLLPIPRDIYDFKKYKFEHATCSFKIGNHHKLKTDKNVCIGVKGNLYGYDKFDTLVRYNKDKTSFAIYKSMHEACRLISKSLFEKDVSCDINDVFGRLETKKIRLENEDDIKYLLPIYSKKYGWNNSGGLIRKRLQTTPSCYFIEANNTSCAKIVLFGCYSDINGNTKQCKTPASFVIEELIYDQENVNREGLKVFINKVLEELKNENLKKVIIKDPLIIGIGNWSYFNFRESYLRNLVLDF